MYLFVCAFQYTLNSIIQITKQEVKDRYEEEIERYVLTYCHDKLCVFNRKCGIICCWFLVVVFFVCFFGGMHAYKNVTCKLIIKNQLTYLLLNKLLKTKNYMNCKVPFLQHAVACYRWTQ